MKSILLALALFISQGVAVDALAAGKITYLNVVDDTVYFATDETKGSTPACVAFETTEQWTVSLSNKTGRAIYSLLVTAMAGKQAINVETGDDCGDIAGIERAKGISLQPVNEAIGISADVKGLYLFQGDGVTKVGRIAEVLSPTSFYYLPLGGGDRFELYDSEAMAANIKQETYVYFETSNCTGTAYAPSSVLPGQVFFSPAL